jgi:hypothetical protein
MPEVYVKPLGKINRVDSFDGGEAEEPIIRENLLTRSKRIKKVRGTEKVNTSGLNNIPRWLGRYYSTEIGIVSPKTFVYTQDGILYEQNDQTGVETQAQIGFKTNARPKHTLIKYSGQMYMYFADGEKLYKYDGNSDNNFADVGVSFHPTDLEEHLDRLWAIDDNYLYVSANFAFDDFSNATDSLQIVVGSGKGKNISIEKLNEYIYIFNTEGIFVVYGTVISAQAGTFEIRKVCEKKCVAGGSTKRVENAILFLADDLELWSFNGTSTPEMLSYSEQLKLSINPYELSDICATYFNNYYQLSFTETGDTGNKLEIWWDAIENRIDFVRGRNVSCYLDIDPSREPIYQQTGRSDDNFVMWCERGLNFDGRPIKLRLRTRNVLPKSEELRICRLNWFYFSFEPTGKRNMFVRYLLDDMISNTAGSDTSYLLNLQGGFLSVGMININNDYHHWVRTRPLIAGSLGHSVAFDIYDDTLNMDFSFIGIKVVFEDADIT